MGIQIIIVTPKLYVIPIQILYLKLGGYFPPLQNTIQLLVQWLVPSILLHSHTHTHILFCFSSRHVVSCNWFSGGQEDNKVTALLTHAISSVYLYTDMFYILWVYNPLIYRTRNKLNWIELSKEFRYIRGGQGKPEFWQFSHWNLVLINNNGNNNEVADRTSLCLATTCPKADDVTSPHESETNKLGTDGDFWRISR